MKLFETYLQFKEELLNEGKNLEKTIQIYLPKIRSANPFISTDEKAEDLIRKLIKLDPTYKEGSNYTGDYGTWILDKLISYTKEDNIEKFYGTDITQLLNDFIDVKQSLPNKDIGSYKSIEDLRKAIDSATLTNRQLQRRKRHSKDFHLVYEDKDWEVYIPDSFRGSCTLGSGTGWCTAYTEDDYMYKYYKSLGNLYILINKDGSKYQFSFANNEFRDAKNHGINVIKFWLDNPELMNLFISEGETHPTFHLISIISNIQNRYKPLLVVPGRDEFEAGFMKRFKLYNGTVPSSVLYYMFNEPVEFCRYLYIYAFSFNENDSSWFPISEKCVSFIKKTYPYLSGETFSELLYDNPVRIVNQVIKVLFITLAISNKIDITNDVVYQLNNFYGHSIGVMNREGRWTFMVRDKNIIKKAIEDYANKQYADTRSFTEDFNICVLQDFPEYIYKFDPSKFTKFDEDVFIAYWDDLYN